MPFEAGRFYHPQFQALSKIYKGRWLGAVRQMTIMRKKADQVYSSLTLAPQKHELVLLLNLPLTLADC